MGVAASAESIVAYRDAALDAFVIPRRPLRYARGADPAEDRSAHVRAASALVRFSGELVISDGPVTGVALGAAELLEIAWSR